jgi:branched-chain amino acid transport system ATP-binding protein
LASAPAPSADGLRVDGLKVRRGRVEVVRDVSVSVAPGACVGLLGLNGAGKSTLLACIAGTLPAAAGSVRLNGEDISRQPSWTRCARGLVLVPAGRQLFGELTVLDNLLVGAHVHRSRAVRERLLGQAYDYFPVLADKRHQKARELSGGQQQMLAIARGLMAQPKALLLDEPSEGLAPLVVEQVFDSIAEMKRTGSLAILLAEQNAGASEICDSVVVLRNGAVADAAIAPGTSGDVAGVVFG